MRRARERAARTPARRQGGLQEVGRTPEQDTHRGSPAMQEPHSWPSCPACAITSEGHPGGSLTREVRQSHLSPASLSLNSKVLLKGQLPSTCHRDTTPNAEAIKLTP